MCGPLIDDKFCYDIVKVCCANHLAAARNFHSHFDNFVTQFIINKRKDARKSDLNLLT